MKYYEICRRINPRFYSPTTFCGRILKKIFPQHDSMVECFVIRTNKTIEEIIKHYGGPCYVDGVTKDSLLARIVKKNKQEVPII